ncbi:MAG: TolC family protein [Bacteroidales bacterium]|nr:TolC family protein [Bacteroidales bacterium]MCF8344631.1 TolC family protein [Bacteroidales bacterium]MCF8351070.1 TolC family protein [Bacteroidales bacterium]MCF8377384.1 TolC family protein [Bacteroidales bacterium]MCF8402216.1 TolC family protein [Bacteroidales bacterium]
MKTKLILTVSIFFLSIFVNAQDPIKDVLLQVMQNNKSIQKFDQYIESRIMEAKTNLTPSNPSFEMDYLWGDEPGTYLREIGVSQEFEFPTVYAKQGKIANKQMEQFNYQQQKFNWDILHKARMLCIELIYLNKMEAEYSERQVAAERFLKNQKQRLEQGYGSILEVDKARLHESSISNKLRRIRSKIKVKLNHLQEMNGGREIVFESSDYPHFEAIPQIDSLFAKLEAVDPENKIIEMRIQESDLEIGLAKAKSYPGFEVGYKSENEFLNTFSGVHFGISIPLWEDKNKVKHSKLRQEYLYLEIAEHEINHYYEIKETYTSLISIQKMLLNLENAMDEIRFKENLIKALESGEISVIDFYRENLYLYDIIDNYLETEKEYYLLMAEIYKFKLLEIDG